jgi:transketolase
MMNTHAWHGKAPNDAQLENALAQNNAGGELDYKN